jgi:hypothetical protein
MVTTVSVAAILGLTLNVAAIAATAQTPEEALAAIEKNFAQMQITKDPITIQAVSAVMADDFYSFNPTHGVRSHEKAASRCDSVSQVCRHLDGFSAVLHSCLWLNGHRRRHQYFDSHAGWPGRRRQLRVVRCV